jgi:hypothetical protein
LNAEVPHFGYALNIILDSLGEYLVETPHLDFAVKYCDR